MTGKNTKKMAPERTHSNEKFSATMHPSTCKLYKQWQNYTYHIKIIAARTTSRTYPEAKCQVGNTRFACGVDQSAVSQATESCPPQATSCWKRSPTPHRHHHQRSPTLQRKQSELLPHWHNWVTIKSHMHQMMNTQHQYFQYSLMTHTIQTILPSLTQLNSTINAQAMSQIHHTHHITPALQYRTKILQQATASQYPVNTLQDHQCQQIQKTVTFQDHKLQNIHHKTIIPLILTVLDTNNQPKNYTLQNSPTVQPSKHQLTAKIPAIQKSTLPDAATKHIFQDHIKHTFQDHLWIVQQKTLQLTLTQQIKPLQYHHTKPLHTARQENHPYYQHHLHQWVHITPKNSFQDHSHMQITINNLSQDHPSKYRHPYSRDQLYQCLQQTILQHNTINSQPPHYHTYTPRNSNFQHQYICQL